MDPEVIARLRADLELRELAINARVRFGFASDATALASDGVASDGPAFTSDGPAFASDGPWPVFFGFDGAELTVASEPDAEGTDFVLRLPPEAWADLLSARPTPGRQSILAYLAPDAGGDLVGESRAFAQNLQLVRRIIEVARPQAAAPAPAPEVRSPAGIVGGYVRVEVPRLGSCDVYYEHAGSGHPVVLLATAGSDTRQFHGLMTDPELTGSYEFFALDLPWHGKSNPVFGARNSSYHLDSAIYVEAVVRAIGALGLQKPVLVGSSMAGAAVIEVAARHPDSVRGVIGAQVGPRVANRRTPWIRNPAVNQTLHVAEWTYGLMSPESPKAYRDRVWWGYSQGGFGVYDADLEYYTTAWDIDNVSQLLDGSVPIVLLSGSYDYSVPPSATRELASAISGAQFREMPELGHFPHAENPPVFAGYLAWALGEILAHSNAATTGVS